MPSSLISTKQRSNRVFVGTMVAIVCIGLFIRVLAAFQWQKTIDHDAYFKFGDSDTYWVLARSITNGTPYQYGSPNSKIFRAPLYPLFLAPSTLLVPPEERATWQAVMAARLSGCLLGAVCIFMVSMIASRAIRNKFDVPESTGWIACGIGAGFLATLYPGAIGMSIFILSEAVFCPLILVSLYCTWRFLQINESHSAKLLTRWIFLAGVFSGAACLARPSWSLWPAVLFVYLFLVFRRIVRDQPDASPSKLAKTPNGLMSWGVKKWAASCIFFCVGMCVVMSPWWIRNYLVTGKFVPTTLQVGASLYDGWHAGASGSSDENMEFVNQYIAEQLQADEETLRKGMELESTLEWRLDQRIKNAAIQWARENSPDAIGLGLIKFRKTWAPLPIAHELGSNLVRWCEAVGYVSIMVFAIIGLWKSWNCIGSWLFAMPCIYFAVLHMFFIGSVRYRQPAVLVLCVIGGIGFAELAKQLSIIVLKRRTIDGSIAPHHVTADKTPS